MTNPHLHTISSVEPGNGAVALVARRNPPFSRDSITYSIVSVPVVAWEVRRYPARYMEPETVLTRPVFPSIGCDAPFALKVGRDRYLLNGCAFTHDEAAKELLHIALSIKEPEEMDEGQGGI